MLALGASGMVNAVGNVVPRAGRRALRGGRPRASSRTGGAVHQRAVRAQPGGVLRHEPDPGEVHDVAPRHPAEQRAPPADDAGGARRRRPPRQPAGAARPPLTAAFADGDPSRSRSGGFHLRRRGYGCDVSDFLTDVQTLRANARQHIDHGPITEAYGADRERVIEVLNQALATELVCVLRYKRHYYMAEGHQLRPGRRGVPAARHRGAGPRRLDRRPHRAAAGRAGLQPGDADGAQPLRVRRPAPTSST